MSFAAKTSTVGVSAAPIASSTRSAAAASLVNTGNPKRNGSTGRSPLGPTDLTGLRQCTPVLAKQSSFFQPSFEPLALPSFRPPSPAVARPPQAPPARKPCAAPPPGRWSGVDVRLLAARLWGQTRHRDGSLALRRATPRAAAQTSGWPRWFWGVGGSERVHGSERMPYR